MKTPSIKTSLIVVALLLFHSASAQALESPRWSSVQSDAGPIQSRTLFCAYGSIGLRPNPLPQGFETQFAIAVVEIRSPREIRGGAASEFTVTNQEGKETKSKRIIATEEFVRIRSNEADMAYYLNPEGARPWNGTLPAGTIRLRVRVALTEAPQLPVRFRLVLGDIVFEGAVNGMWLS